MQGTFADLTNLCSQVSSLESLCHVWQRISIRGYGDYEIARKEIWQEQLRGFGFSFLKNISALIKLRMAKICAEFTCYVTT